MTNRAERTDRLTHMDSIRVIMIVGVVLYHALMTHSDHSPWWPVRDARGAGFSELIALMDITLMPVLFFVAGYFLPSSMRRHGPAGFALTKLKRLGIPLVLVTLFSNPVASYIRHLRVADDPLGLFDYWTGQLATAKELMPTFLAGNVTAERLADHLSLWHLWFISLLLVLTLLVAAGAALYRRTTSSAEADGPAPRSALGGGNAPGASWSSPRSSPSS